MNKNVKSLLALVLTGCISQAAFSQKTKDTVKTKVIDEVVVTALGIKRMNKSLGYAAENKDSKIFEDTQNNNWANALEGKVAGLKIQTAGAGPLGSARITLRGEKSFDMDSNNALIVIDGVPMSNNTTGTGASAYGAGAGGDLPIDYGNGINSINPDDIASVTILKGASAAALYGSRAANGAIMITTKSGAGSKKLRVSFSSDTSFDTVLKWPDYQYEYGQGTLNKDKSGKFYYSYGASEDGVNTGSTSSAFGPKFNGQSYFQYDPNIIGPSLERQLWRPYKNNIKGFWQAGETYSNNLSLENSNDKTSFRTSLGYVKNNWMMPNTGFNRFNFSTSLTHQLNEKLKITTKVMYSKMMSDNLPATGYNNQSISYFMIFQNPNVDLAWYRPIWRPGKEGIDQIHPFSSYIDNPYMIAYEMLNSANNNQLNANITLNYKINNNFDVMFRSGLEWQNDIRSQRRPFSSANYPQGYYREEHITNQEYNNDILFTYKNSQKDSKIGISASLGGSIRYNEYRYEMTRATGLRKPNIYTLSNGLSLFSAIPSPKDRQENSIYGLVSLNYGKYVYLDLTARNDWTSTLRKGNNSFFYPSASTSFILSDIFGIKNTFDFWKLRLSVAGVGNGTKPYRLDRYYSIGEISGSVVAPNTLNNINLLPEKNTNYEGGMDFSMFKNRLGINFTFYKNITKNQIVEIPALTESGFRSRFINSGSVENKGLEITLNATPIKKPNFSWNINANWSANRNKVLSLPAEFEGNPYTVASVGDVLFYQVRVGGSLGDMYGYKLQRTPDGQVIYDPSTGLPTRPADIEYVGNAFPEWRAGLQNEFKIKNFRISFSFDGQYKGMAYSQSHHKMSEQGKLGHTLWGRENPDGMVIGEGVIKNADGSFSPNTKKVLLTNYYGDYYRRANVETNSFDTSFIKLRDARVSYTFPDAIIGKLKLKELTIALYGKNLWMWTKFPLFDPEAATLNNSTITPGAEVGQLPSAKTIGMQLNVKF
ncbi:SusC/RagA family protein [Elizabethkingia anophelis]|nr:SusC/RagA family protein [Elizabethkingia anophelis]